MDGGGLGSRMRALIDAGFAPSAAFEAFCARCARAEAAVSAPPPPAARPPARASRREALRLAAEFDRACTEARAWRRNSDWNGEKLIAAALALWRVSPQTRCARAVAGRLRCASSWRERAQAAFALAQMPTLEAEEALYAALADADARVRHGAARSLLVFHGVALDGRANEGAARLGADIGVEPPP